MGVTASTSLGKLRDNPVLQKFVGAAAVPDGDEYWKELLLFSHTQGGTPAEAKLWEESTTPLVESLVKHNPSSGNLRSLIKVCLEYAASLRDESNCESNILTWRVHNALLILRTSLKYMLLNLSEEEVILQIDGSTTVPQLSTLKVRTAGNQAEESAPTPAGLGSLGQRLNPSIDPSSGDDQAEDRGKEKAVVELPVGVDSPIPSVTATEMISMETLLSRQLVEGVVSLLADVPLLPFTYDIHVEAINLFLVLLSTQMFGGGASGSVLLQHIVSVSSDLSVLLVQCLLHHITTSPPLPPEHFRSQSTGIISSITSGLWWLVSPTRSSGSGSTATGGGVSPSPLRDHALLLLLVLSHQQTGGYNPFRSALASFTDERSSSPFSLSLEKLYLALCQQLHNEQTTLFLYLLLQGNANFASFIFSRSDIDLLVLPVLQQLYSCGQQSSHHVYMLLILLLILSQDECFNKSIHELTVPRVPWYADRAVASISLGSLMVMVLVRTIQVNIAHVRDKYLHTNCLAALANMSSHFHSLHLDAARKLVNLFKLLAKKSQRMTARLKAPKGDTPPQTQYSDYATEQQIVEEILQMVLEIMNSCLTHSLHHNPHLVYSLLYQREVFEPFRTHPSLMDLVHNIETVITFFSSRLEKTGPSPYSSAFVLETIVQASKSWPRNRLRVFPELKFRYVEEDQPDEFFIPYVWTLVFKSSSLYWDSTRIQFSATL